MHKKSKRLWREKRIAAELLAAFLLPGVASAAPPSAGAILQQNSPPAAMPAAPGSVIELPAPKQQAVQSSTPFAVERVELHGNTHISSAELAPLLKSAIGAAVTLAQLQQVATHITDYYHAHGFPLAYAYVPEQKIRAGVVTMDVVEARYDQVEITGASRLRASEARRTLGVAPGETVEQGPLERGLLLLNQTPGVRVAGTLVPGASVGTSTLKAQLTDMPIFRGGVGLDDYGNRYTGRTRALAQATIDNPLGFGGQLGVNVLRTAGDRLRSEGFNALSPNIANGLRVGVYGSSTRYNLGGVFAPLQEGGHANQIGVYAGMPLILAPGRVLEARVDVLRDNLAQSSAATGLNDHSHIDIWRLTLDGSLADSSGVTSGGVFVAHSNDRPDGAGSVSAGAAGSAWIGQAQVQRMQQIAAGFQLRGGLSGQIASHNLDGSQKFYLGGPDGVMGYDVGDGGGDAGVLAQIGLYHAIPLSMPGRLTAGISLQDGKVWVNHSPSPGAVNQVNLASAALEVSYTLNSRVDVEASYAHSIGHAPAASGVTGGSEFWLGVRVNF